MIDLLAMIVGPAAFWLLYHYYRDRTRPEPFGVLLVAYAAGVVAGAACLRVFELLNRLGLEAGPEDGRPAFLAYCVLGVGGLEEAAKLLPFLAFALRSRHFDEAIDGVVYASVVALGFASYENWRYMEFLDGLPMAARAVASPLTHAVFASIWGHAVGSAIHDGRGWLRPLALAFVLAAVAHGVYDFVAVGLHPLFRPATAAIVLAIWVWRLRLFHRLETSTPG